MSREIKFRAWEKNLKEMIPVYSIDFEKKIINTESAWRIFDEVELMQYTGLKDKNGKEIYEGDIVQYKELIPSTNSLQQIIQGADFVYMEFKGTIVWDEEGCSFDVDGGEHGYRGFGARGTVEIEVIGNIYENPELLKE